ncbi:hypothetical protein ACLMJK_007719 [Lecanora helva]
MAYLSLHFPSLTPIPPPSNPKNPLHPSSPEPATPSKAPPEIRETLPKRRPLPNPNPSLPHRLDPLNMGLHSHRQRRRRNRRYRHDYEIMIWLAALGARGTYFRDLWCRWCGDACGYGEWDRGVGVEAVEREEWGDGCF